MLLRYLMLPIRVAPYFSTVVSYRHTNSSITTYDLLFDAEVESVAMFSAFSSSNVDESTFSLMLWNHSLSASSVAAIVESLDDDGDAFRLTVDDDVDGGICFISIPPMIGS